jgi:hypothetical protein
LGHGPNLASLELDQRRTPEVDWKRVSDGHHLLLVDSLERAYISQL